MSPDLVRERLISRIPLLAATLVAAIIELWPGVPVAALAPAGLWLSLGAPAALWYAAGGRVLSSRDGRALLAVGLAVVTDMAVALVVNTIAPVFGVSHPLGRVPLCLALVTTVLVLAVTCRLAEAGEGARWWLGGRVPGRRAVLAAGAAVVTLSVAGAVRLNNGLGGAVSVVAVVAIAALLAGLVARRRRYPTAVTTTGLFFAGAGLLLLTSSRSWYVMGHDIQLEYQVFRLTLQADRWNVAAFRDPYNSCLSITLLPAALVRLTGLSGVHVFKVVLPLLFALTPALVYRSVRNVGSPLLAVLSAGYFMMFPTFFTDMTFLARQEIAFLLLGCLMVVVTDRGRPPRDRRLVVAALLIGIVVAHYSTTYVVVVTLGAAVGVDRCWRPLSRWRGTRPVAPSPALVTVWMVLLTGAAATLWAGPVTHTSRGAVATITATGRALLGEAAPDSSSDTVYSLVGGARVTPGRRLAAFRAETAAAPRTTSEYLPAGIVDDYQTAAVVDSGMALTPVGSALARAGLDVRALNGLVRAGAARLLQVLLLLGLLVTLVARRPVFRPSRDQVTLSAGSLGVIGVLTILPGFSVDYGVLRAFQQGLLFFAPFIAAASIWIFRWARRATPTLASGLALVLFLDLAGVVPRLLGGYPAQLQLDNAGQYYDIYYVHPAERAAFAWLSRHTTPLERRDIQTDRQGFDGDGVRERTLNDIYPTLVGAENHVVLGYTTVRKGLASVFYRGDLVTYQYPTALLDATKDKIYSSAEAGIYR